MMTNTKFHNAIGSDADLKLLKEWYATAQELDGRGLFDKAKGYYNGCMSLILSKRITFPKVEA